MENEIKVQKIYAVLDDKQNVLTYSETGGIELTESEYMAQLQNPGVYTWTGAAFAYEAYKPREPTADEIKENTESEARRLKMVAVEGLTPEQIQAIKDSAVLAEPTLEERVEVTEARVVEIEDVILEILML